MYFKSIHKIMFGLLKKKIVSEIYFLLILTIPIFCSGIIIYEYLTQGIVMITDNNPENSEKDISSKIDFSEIDQIESIANFQFNLIQFNLLQCHIHTNHYLLSIYNVCLAHKTPPP